MADGALQAGAGETCAEREFRAHGRVGDLGDQGLGGGEVRLRGGNLRRRDAFGELRERVGLGGEKIPSEALVAVRLSDLSVERAELMQRFGDGLSVGVAQSAEDRAARGEVGLGVRGETPGLREARRHRQPSGRPRLVVAVVAPGGEQDAARFMPHRGTDGFGLVGERIVEAAGEALPRAGARCDEVGAAEFAEATALFLEGVTRIVTPHDRHGVGRRVLRERQVFEKDVAPELHGVAAITSERAERLEVIEVDAMLTALGHGLLAEALPELPRFVAADVHLTAAEIRQVVVE